MLFVAPPRRYASYALAAAAGLVLGILTMLPGYLRPAGPPQAPLLAMINSHFNHAQFAAVGSTKAPGAKVIYARDRSWLYILADGSEHYAVYAINGTASTRLGDLQPGGSTSALYVARAPAANAVELRDGATVVERAALR